MLGSQATVRDWSRFSHLRCLTYTESVQAQTRLRLTPAFDAVLRAGATGLALRGKRLGPDRSCKTASPAPAARSKIPEATQ
jgi:hypothetical protein